MTGKCISALPVLQFDFSVISVSEAGSPVTAYHGEQDDDPFIDRSPVKSKPVKK